MSDVPECESAEGGVALWGSAAWRESAVAWLDERLGVAGIERKGAVEQPHLRPWATALSVPTTRGVYWLKAPGPANTFEVRLYRLLSRLVPASVLAPLAIDDARGWILLPDGGPTLGASVAGPDRVPALANAMAAYARLQRELTPHADQLVQLGVADMRPAVMPQRFEQARAAVEAQLERDGSAADRATYERVVSAEPEFARRCRELASSPGAASLDHGDLHPGNIFASQVGAPVRFYDWGDSVVAHPFASLLVALGVLRKELGASVHDARLQHVQSAYLAVFDDLAPRAELVHTLELACHVAKIARVLTWQRALQTLERDEPSPFARAPLRWFGAVLDPDYVSVGG
jgi:hypothetical protein